MKSGRDIPWFNPRQMDDATVIALSTGRGGLLRECFDVVRERCRQPAAGRHFLATGPRGAGKSYFLRLVQAMFSKVIGEQATFVLLPEELPNVFAAHEWLREVQRLLPGSPASIGQSPAWQVKDEGPAWEAARQALFAAFPGPLLVIGVENFDQLLAQAFDNDVRASRLRDLMENEPRIMLLATALEGEFDEDYEKRLFRQFEHHSVPRWDEQDHRHYLERRARLIGKEPTLNQLARIDAYSRYTGGNARVAAMLAGAILDEVDLLHTSHDLTATLDRMSDYYRSLHERMPVNTRKIFDALIRGGEPASQVELASRIGARQNEISRAFAWLIDHGYVLNERIPGRKEHCYRVADRLFVQFYRMRYLEPDQPSRLAILADLLAATIEFGEKWRLAEKYFSEGSHPEAQLMAELGCADRGVNVTLLPEELRTPERLMELGRRWRFLDQFKIGEDFAIYDFVRACFARFQTDEKFRTAYEEAKTLATAVRRGDLLGTELAELIDGSLSQNPVGKYRCFAAMLNSKFTDTMWRGVAKAFRDEIEEFKKLEPIAGEAIAKLREKRVLGMRFPLAASLSNLAGGRIQGTIAIFKLFDLVVAVEWAAKSVCLWSQHNRPDEIKESLSFCWAGIRQLLNRHYHPNEARQILESLHPQLSCLSAEDQMMLHGLHGQCLEAMNLHSAALDAFRSARNLALSEAKPSEAAWFQERFAWSMGALGRLEESIAAHEIAHNERLALGNELDTAWNPGQIARHSCRLQSLEDAWKILDTADHQKESARIYALQQLGDAVWDAVRLEGETKAFAFARQILSGVAVRPQYPPEASVRALWIGMIDTGVPLPLLRDLLQELPLIFSFAKESIEPLATVLHAWLDDLECAPDQRTQRRQSLPPDLAATLDALAKNLSPKARSRFEILESGIDALNRPPA